MDSDETGIDCGGSCDSCNDDTNCSDGLWNGNETGVDCGGPDCEACPSCEDGIQNQDETAVDCGGICGICPTCSDGVQNGNEEGIDCGGSSCEACPSCEDGILNQGEEAIDCGGPCEACVEVNPPCEINSNSSDYPLGFSPASDNYSSVACGLDLGQAGNNWSMIANGPNSDLTVIFPGDIKPTEGIYKTVSFNQLSTWSPDSKVLHLHTVAGGAFSLQWNAVSDQDVYVEAEGTLVRMTFCDLQFSDPSGQFPTNINVSGSLECD